MHGGQSFTGSDKSPVVLLHRWNQVPNPTLLHALDASDANKEHRCSGKQMVAFTYTDVHIVHFDGSSSLSGAHWFLRKAFRLFGLGMEPSVQYDVGGLNNPFFPSTPSKKSAAGFRTKTSASSASATSGSVRTATRDVAQTSMFNIHFISFNNKDAQFSHTQFRFSREMNWWNKMKSPVASSVCFEWLCRTAPSGEKTLAAESLRIDKGCRQPRKNAR